MRALEETKDAYRDRWSEALMIASEAVIAPAHELNETLARVHGQVKRLEQGNHRPDESLPSAADAQHALWSLIDAMREAMRRDLGITGEAGGEPARRSQSPSSGDPTALTRVFMETRDGPNP
ncbi:hypothetical protein MOV08_42850 [Streptomyces yunnanensis]|uniref:Uncharacterized protein n=1 Tax=Streptomyces yunnanensis TaxID=156453 RepID=A0ABY8APF2_9ACTN|nr:hypothetical protein [Streptomyces yunnanensis]WEB45372.1 hypothetical protein MOV08_42850 [Streptomyces yunnanensis]